jgi:hypothetical protein
MHTGVTQLAGIHPIEVCGIIEFCRIHSAKLHIILNLEERIAQKVKTIAQFVKPKYRKIIVTLHPDSKE